MAESTPRSCSFEAIEKDAPALLGLHVQHPSLTIITSSSPGFQRSKEIYNLDIPTRPLAIVKPRSPEEVATTVQYSVLNNIPLTVRGGGHDLWGRSMADDAVVIDMRCLNHVKIVDGVEAALVGGGILTQDLLTALEPIGYTVPTGAYPSVGFVGWATLGGMGLRSGSYGLGCDQIIGAKLVNWQGAIFDADEELLWGIRGAGGNFGVIVELRIRIYPVIKGLAGLLYFQSDDFGSRYASFLGAYRDLISSGLPSSYGAMQGVTNDPNLGRTITIVFVWNSSDHNEGRRWLERIKACGNLIMDTVIEISPLESLLKLASIVPPAVYLPDGLKSVSIPQAFSDKYVDIAVKNYEKMPLASATAGLCHHVHGRATASMESESSCFGYRKPHLVLEIIGASLDYEARADTGVWSERFHRELRMTDEVILKGGYVALNQPTAVKASECFGDNWERLMTLKEKHDPKNIFRFAAPQLV